MIDKKLFFLKKAFGNYKISYDKLNIAVCCPKCKTNDKKKLAIHLITDLCNCWVCGQGGRLVHLLVQHKPSLVHEYVTKFVGRNITLLDDAGAKRVAVLPEGFRLLAPIMDSSEPSVRWAINYLRKRGMTERDMWYFKFGISSDGAMQRRVIMPSFDGAGTLNFYTGRAIDADAFRKYMNCDVEKKVIIFNELNIDWKRELTLVEGPFDLTKCDDNATCLLGSSLSEDSALFSMVYRHNTPVVLALDSDMVNKTWQRIARMLSSYDIAVRILDLGGFKDVGEMTRQQFMDAKASAVGWDRVSAIRMKINTIRN